jgi:hypothetical protein
MKALKYLNPVPLNPLPLNPLKGTLAIVIAALEFLKH